MINDFLSHFNIVVSVVLVIVGYIKLVQSSKSNGDKLDSVIAEAKNMSIAQQDIKMEVNKQGIQMSNVAKDVGEIKSDIRSHDKEINELKSELAGFRSQLKAS